MKAYFHFTAVDRLRPLNHGPFKVLFVSIIRGRHDTTKSVYST
jgi:hypothetical protein